MIFEIYNMCMNYGYAYRFAAFENLKRHLESYFLRGFETKIIWDTGHNSISYTDDASGRLFCHRHNSSAIAAGKPCLIAGYNNVNSLIGMGLQQCDGLDSYDHGFGTLIGEKQSSMKYRNDNRFTIRTEFERGCHGSAIKSERINHYDTEIMIQNFKVYEDRKVMKLAASLRPVANFKN